MTRPQDTPKGRSWKELLGEDQDLLRELRGLENNAPVIMISGHGTISDAVAATHAGAFDFLEKPVPYKKLLQTVESALNSRPTRSQSATGASSLIRIFGTTTAAPAASPLFSSASAR